jgi:hypothetical protein
MRQRDLPPEWGGIVPTEIFISEALRIVEAAEEKGVKLRILGGLGIRLHSKGWGEFSRLIGRSVEAPVGGRRQEYTDLDLMGYWRQNRQVRELFEGLGFLKRRATLGDVSLRQIYFHGRGWFHVDVFYDSLKMNHDIPFKGRLELDTPTVPLVDLLLSKLQIVQFNEKDLKDCWLLLRSHALGEGPGDHIDQRRVAESLSGDWGFWYTATTNLRRIAEAARGTPLIPPADQDDIAGKVEGLLRRVSEEPKGVAWRARSLVGTAKKWYRPVETEATVGDRGLWRVDDARSRDRV